MALFKVHKIPFVNYLGQIRLYSLIDLVLMLLAAKAGKYEFAGAIMLHLGFLAYLERNHNHSYRRFMPPLIWVVLTILGILTFQHIEVIGYLLFSYLYTLKKNKPLGVYSPIFRGLQSFFIAGALIGYNYRTILVFFILALRNFAGDVRDIEKDRKEKMITLPMLMGMKNNNLSIHLFTLMMTSAIWFSFLDMSFYWLAFVFIIQILSYDLTPR